MTDTIDQGEICPSTVSLFGNMDNFPMEPREAAKIMMDRGIKVIPFRVRGKTKTPLLKKWSPYNYSWQMIEPQITEAFGIVVPKGLIVIDLDRGDDGGYAGLDALADLAMDCNIKDLDWLHTMTSDTPSGGTHLFYRIHPRAKVSNSAGKIGQNIDVRVAEKGLVLMPPSRNGLGEPYLFSGTDTIQKIPLWLLAQINETEAEKAQIGAAIRKIDMDLLVNDKSVAKYLERRTSYISASHSGERNNTLNAVAYSIYRRVVAGLVPQYAADSAIENAALMSGLESAEVTRTMQSALAAAEANPVVFTQNH